MGRPLPVGTPTNEKTALVFLNPENLKTIRRALELSKRVLITTTPEINRALDALDEGV